MIPPNPAELLGIEALLEDTSRRSASTSTGW